MNRLLLIAILLALSNNFFAQNIETIDEGKAKTVALNWLNEYADYFVDYEFSIKEKPIKIFDKDYHILGFVFNLRPKGFVIVSSNMNITPVPGFSFSSDFDSKTDNFWKRFVKDDLSSRFSHLKISDKKILDENKKKWGKLLWVENKNSDTKVFDIVGPFLESNWSQGYVNGELVFNYYTPNHWSAGCVATAMAQILNYYKWPLKGTGSHSYYEDDAGNIYVNYSDTWYDWENTLDDYENNVFTLAQQKAAGLLTFHAAVSVNMDFEATGSTSSTSDVPYALHGYFRYSGHYSSVNSSGFWNALKNNMLDLRPAILSIKRSDGFGHAAVVDGYFETNNYYHLNPGWGGNYDGWYDISGDWEMSGYTIVVGAAKGIVPSPMINDISRVSELSFDLSWSVSRFQYADYYELQEARNYGGPWTTLNSNISDTLYRISVTELGSYYYRVRARRDGIWWDWSKPKKVQLGSERAVTFRVKLPNENQLNENEIFVVRGNIPPLSGNENSPPFNGPDSEGIYSLTLNFDFDYVGQTIIYRFFIDSLGTLFSENENRYYDLTSEASQILPVAIFNEFPDAVSDDVNLPSEIILYQNYPNPFNPTTSVKYFLPNGEKSEYSVRLSIFNILGREIRVLVNGKQTSGEHSVVFNSERLSSGIYFYKLTVDNHYSEIKKMIILK